MLICVVGSGGREHALAAVLGRYAEVVVTPGNPGIPGSTPESAFDVRPDLVVVGPEAFMCEVDDDGLSKVDKLRRAGIPVFGPGSDGAWIEGSKYRMKELLLDAGVPTAQYMVFTRSELDAALEYLRERWAAGIRQVIKTSGLAAGKGSCVPATLAEAEADLRAKLNGEAFGDAGTTVVIEDELVGREVSVFFATDGKHVVQVGPLSRDYKRNARGEMTGGMGAYAPVSDPLMPTNVASIFKRHAQAVVDELRIRGIDYRGLLYFGYMLTEDGPYVLEINIRFGDPETQAVLQLVDPAELRDVLWRCANGGLRSGDRMRVLPGAAVNIVLASPDYPKPNSTAYRLEGLADARRFATVYVAAAIRGDDGELQAKGGRLLSIVGAGDTLAKARDNARRAVAMIGLVDPATGKDVKQVVERVGFEQYAT